MLKNLTHKHNQQTPTKPNQSTMSNKFWKSFSIVLNVLFDEIVNQQKVFKDAYTNLDDVELVNLLIEYTEIDISANNNFAIRYASAHGHIAVVDRLLQDRRVDPSAKNNYAIRWASHNGHIAVVKLLLEHQNKQTSKLGAIYNWCINLF